MLKESFCTRDPRREMVDRSVVDSDGSHARRKASDTMPLITGRDCKRNVPTPFQSELN